MSKKNNGRFRVVKRLAAALFLLLVCVAPCFAQQVLSISPSGAVIAPVDQNGWHNFKVVLTQNVTSFSFNGWHNFKVVLTQNVTSFSFVILPPMPPPAQAVLTVIFTENATGGFTVAFASNISNPCVIATVSNATTVCQFNYDGTSNAWLGSGTVSANANNAFSGNNSFPNLVAPTIGPSLNQQHTIPAVASDTFGLLAAVQTFSNKSFSTQIISTVSTGTAPFSIASTTVVPNLNAALLNGATLAAPGAIGGTTPGAGTFTALNAKSISSGGTQFADQFAGADASVKVNACIAQVIANGGGKCDASGLYGAQVISQEIDVGNHAQNPVTLILPQGATWTVTGITNGTSCALKLFSQSSILGPGTGGSSAMVIHGGAVTNNLDSLLCTEAAPNGNGSYVRAEGFQLFNPNAATVANGTLNVQATFDDSDFRNITVAAYGTVGANVHGLVCCGTAFHGLTVNGNGVAGSKPLVVNLNTVTAEVAFYDLSADFPGTGQNAISVSTVNNTRAVRFFNTYISGSQTDNTTADISVTSTGGPVDFFGVSCNNSGTSTAYCLDIASAANVSVHVYGLQQVVGGSSNCINDHFLSVTSTGGPVDFFGITCNNSGTSTAYCIDIPSSANVSVHIYGLQQVVGGSSNCINDHFLGVTVPCDSQGNVAAYVLGASNFQQVSLGNKLLIAQANPTISSGFNAGTIGASCNGPSSCNVNVGVGTAGSTGVIGLPTSTAGWNCFASNQTRADVVLMTANSTNSATFTNFGTTFAATNWTNSDNVIFSCFAR